VKNPFRLGVDIGGTFTDFTLVNDDTGEVFIEKCLTTPGNPETAVLEGITSLSHEHPGFLPEASTFIHATTLLTNVILERKGSVTGLLTTAGFRDILEFARELRYDVYDPFITFPKPLVERPLRLEARERVLVDGSVNVPLNEQDVSEAGREFLRMGVQSIAICFLHSYRNGAHEERARAILQEMLPHAQISISSEVHPEPKEYERTSTTVVDAYVKPTAAKYLDKLSAELEHGGYKHGVYVMLSNGGAATASTTKQFPVQAVESGPAAGVEAASHYGRLIGSKSLLSFDMGGTTAKLSIVLNGRAERTRSFEVDRVQRFKPGSGIPIAVPVYDLLEIGAGGGSIARIDSLGLLQVGPDSAGSKPGPASYSLGGIDPTVTDADLLLGFLDADSFLGGSMRLSTDAAAKVMCEKIADPLGISVETAAWGIHNLVNETMASAARVHIAEKGQSPRNLSLVGFGGAGPVHAVGLARKLGCPSVVIPPLPGVMSAFGLLTAPVAIERPKAIRALLRELNPLDLEAWSQELEEETKGLIPAGSDITLLRSVDMWHVGQDYPLELPVTGRWTDPDIFLNLEKAFDELYEQHYGRVDDQTPLELVTLRVKALRATDKPAVRVPSKTTDPKKGTRRMYVSVLGAYEEVPVYNRARLHSGARVQGPAIIEERESTTVIDQGDQLVVDPFGCLIISLSYPDAGESK